MKLNIWFITLILLSFVIYGTSEYEFIKRERAPDPVHGVDIIQKGKKNTTSEYCSDKQSALLLKESLTCINDKDVKVKIPASMYY